MPLHRAFCLILSLALLVAGNAAAGEFEIRFARGATSAMVAGDWQGSTDTHVFRARKGQRLLLRLNDGRIASGHLDLTLYAYCGEEYGTPMASNVARVEATLPCSGRFSIDVAARTDIAIKQDQENYTLFISIR